MNIHFWLLPIFFFGQNVENYFYFSNLLLISQLSNFVYIQQSFYTVVDYKIGANFVLKSWLPCGKLSGKCEKLQQNRVGNPLFHVLTLWKSEFLHTYFIQMPKMRV